MLDDRLDSGAAALAAGDFAAIAVVFAAGTVRHNGLGVLVADPLYVLATIAPFLVGWAIAAPILGAYLPGVRTAPRTAVLRGVVAWLGADAIALALRATPVLHGGVSTTFAAVTVVFGAGGIAVWRGLYTIFR